MGFSKALYAPDTTNFVSVVFLGSKWGFLWAWLVLINAVTLVVYGVDKLLSKIKVKHPSVHRVPEKKLFLLALVGGGLGAWLGMLIFRHKTQHKSFRFGIPLILIVWIALVVGLYVYFTFIR